MPGLPAPIRVGGRDELGDVIGRGSARRGQFVQLGTVAVLVSVGAVVLGWRSVRVGSDEAASAGTVAWALPQEAPSEWKRDLAILQARRPWGGREAFRDIDSGPAPPVVQPWKLVGTIMRNSTRFALIQLGPSPDVGLEYRAVGGRLPDGSTLESIETDAITTTGGHEAGPTVYRLFQQKP
jgi:hypothetical protein